MVSGGGHGLGSQCQNFLAHPLCRNFAVLFLDLDPDTLAAKVFGGAKCSAAAHERINYQFPVADIVKTPLHQSNRFLSWMLFTVQQRLASRIVENARRSFERSPSHFAISERKLPLTFIPISQPIDGGK